MWKIVLLAAGENMQQRIVNESERVYERRKLNVSASKSKVIISERSGEQTIKFPKPTNLEQRAQQCNLVGREDGGSN